MYSISWIPLSFTLSSLEPYYWSVLLFYPCLRNFNNWNSKWTNMLISVSTIVFYSHVLLGRGTSRTCFSPHIWEIVSWRFISASAPSLLLFYCISADLKSIVTAFCALYFLHTRHSLSVFLFLFLALGINSTNRRVEIHLEINFIYGGRIV